METLRICDFPEAPGLFATFYSDNATFDPNKIKADNLFLIDAYDMGVYSIVDDIPRDAFVPNWTRVSKDMYEHMRVVMNQMLIQSKKTAKDYLCINIQQRISYECIKPKIKEFVDSYVSSHPGITFVAIHTNKEGQINRVVKIK